MIERGYERYVVKDDTNAYEPGPTRRWLKVKQKGWTVEENRCRLLPEWRAGQDVARCRLR